MTNATHEKLQVCFLSYDIPDEKSQLNPSGELVHLGIRIEKSVWIIPCNRIPTATVNHLRENGCSCTVVPFDLCAAPTLTALAIARTKAVMQQAVQSARETMESAEQQANDKDEEKVKFWRRVRQALSVARRRLQAAKEAAEGFGLKPSLSFDAGRRALQTLALDAKTRQEAYQAVCDRLAETSPGRGLLATIAANPDSPECKLIASDYLEEQGRQMEADIIRLTQSPL